MSSGLKRPSNTPSSPRKKPRPQYKTLKSLVEEAAKEVDDEIEHVKKEILPLLQEEGLGTVGVKGAMSIMGRVVSAASAPGEKKLGEMRYLDVRIDILDNYPEWAKLQLNDLNTQYANLAIYFRVLLNSLPAPSEFAKTDVWADVQRTRAAILCMRPVEKSGVPICTLHDVFRLFRIRLGTDLSSATDDPIAVASIRAAALLCNEMGNPFDDENSRTAKFNECVRGLLPNFKLNHKFRPKLDRAGCEPNATLFADEEEIIPVCLREDKREAGETGYDVYMQVARDYSIAVKTLEKSSTCMKAGAPMLLPCLLGPHLSVQGGFYDGVDYIVEPLSAMYCMLPDVTKERQNQLARLLYALAKGIEELKELASSTAEPPSFPCGTPRIYSSCTLYADTAADTAADKPSAGTLTFKKPLAVDLINSQTLFTATLSTTSAREKLPEQIPVVVKLVSGSYGEDVHRLLAKEGLAPTLHGCVRLEGAPVAYVMDHLDGDWKRLHDLLRDLTPLCRKAIRESLENVLELLKKKGFVHGDLRSSNIMARIVDEEKAEIKVVDFDWAGKAGQVYYPATRNESIGWPGWPCGPIEAEDDRELLDSWWPRETQV